MKLNLGNIKVNGSPLAYFVELSIFLFILWFMLSGRTEIKFIVMGVGFSLLTSFVCAPFLTVKNQIRMSNVFKFACFHSLNQLINVYF